MVTNLQLLHELLDLALFAEIQIVDQFPHFFIRNAEIQVLRPERVHSPGATACRRL